jgi:hypothetical protein
MPMPTSFYPILTFEESKLCPSLGYFFKRQWLDPCESMVSILWKFARFISPIDVRVILKFRKDLSGQMCSTA